MLYERQRRYNNIAIFLVVSLIYISQISSNVIVEHHLDDDFDYERETLGVLTSPLTDDQKTYIKTRLSNKGFTEKRIEKLIEDTNTSIATFKPYAKMLNKNLVFLIYNDSNEQISKQMEYLDAVILPGGSTLFETDSFDRDGLEFLKVNTEKSGPYLSKAKTILEKAKQINKSGRHFTLLATCLGFQSIILSETDHKCPIARVSVNNRTAPIEFSDFDQNSRMKQKFSHEEMVVCKDNALMFFQHELGFTPSDFNDFKSLTDDYTIVATYKVEKYGDIVVALEHKTMPIYATQFHTEKTLFDDTIFYEINHSSRALDMAYKFASILNNENPTQSNNDHDRRVKRDYHIVSVEYIGYNDKAFLISRNPDLLNLIE